MQRILDEHCHHIPAEEVLGILGVDSARGLDLFEVDHRRERFGPNLLKERKGRSPVLQFLLQCHQPLGCARDNFFPGIMVVDSLLIRGRSWF